MNHANTIQFTQNFLTSPALVHKIVSLAQLETDTAVLEIGPGKGIITKALAERVGANGRVVAVELDAQLAANLQKTLAPWPQIEVRQGNILRFDLSTLGENYAVFANAPFNITSELLTHLFRPAGGPAVAHLILQTEALVGRNKAGIPVETFKSLLIKPLYEVTAVYHFSRSDFRPQPSVDTALFRFAQRAKPTVDPSQYDLYQDFLSFVAQDRVGEGAWLKLFSKKQLQLMTNRTDLVPNRGLKSQSFTAVMAAFETFVAFCGSKHAIVKDSMSQLRHTQQQTNRHNAQGGHHRSRRKKSS